MASFEGLDFEGEVEAGEPTPSVSGALVPRDFVVVRGDQAVLDYSSGRLFLNESLTESTSIIAVAVINEQLLVAVPQSVWHRTVNKRKLPAQCLLRPVLVSLGACSALDQHTAFEGKLPLKVWCGYVTPEVESQLEFPEGGEPTYGFGELEGIPIMPYAESLFEVAREHFGFVSAESGNNGDGADKTLVRLEQLESAMTGIQKSLEALLKQQGNGEDPARMARPKASGTQPKKPKVVSPEEKFTGLDESVVTAALKAGVPAAHLREMSKIMQARPKKLEDVPRKPTGGFRLRGRGRRGGRWRWRSYRSGRRSYRRLWCCKGYSAAHPNLQQTVGPESQEERWVGKPPRRAWIGYVKRDLIVAGEPAQCCSPSCIAEVLEGEPQVDLRECRGPARYRLQLPSDVAWRTSSTRNDSSRLVNQPFQTAALPDPHQVVLAGSRDMGLLDAEQGGRGQGSVLPSSGSIGPSEYRWRKLVAGKHRFAGTCSTLPPFRQPRPESRIKIFSIQLC